jgi:hypothetical protein
MRGTMSDETKIHEAELPKEGPTSETPTGDTTATGDPADPNAPKWEFKREFGINKEMRKVINLTIDATNAEIAVLRRKLQRLTYGS